MWNVSLGSMGKASSVWERKQPVHCCCTIQLTLSRIDKRTGLDDQRVFFFNQPVRPLAGW